MLFKEFYEQSLKSVVVARYGESVANWFLNQFGEYELLFKPEQATNLFKAYLMEMHIQLLNFKKYLELEQIWTFGTTSTSTTSTNSSLNNESSDSYQGYNVNGEFSKNTSTGTSTNSANSQIQTANLNDENLKLLSAELPSLTKIIYNKFVTLFILLYN